jgi:hypothetical protein
MKKTFVIPIFFGFIILPGIFCTNNSTRQEETDDKSKKEKPALTKPVSSYQDTLLIDKTAAVFYHPDSVQLEKIKKIEDSTVFEATMHEYFYQMRNSRIVINKDWPDIKIIEANNVRYLLFKKKNNETLLIDLDTKGDPHGLFLFDQKHDPQLADMMNIDNELPRYFDQK